MSTTVSPATLALETVELVSTLRPAPQNGAPSSLDFNNGELEKITDLTTLAMFINGALLPILNQLSPGAASGLEGTNIYSDTTATDALVYDALDGQSLTITQSLRVLYGYFQTLQTKVTGVVQQIDSIQAQLSASDQSDVALALQNIYSQLALYSTEIINLGNAVSGIQTVTGTMMDAKVQTPDVAPGSTETVSLTWTLPFPDNTYIVTYGIEDGSGFLSVTGFTYLPNGAGVTIYVVNNDTNAAHQGNVHAQGRASQLANN